MTTKELWERYKHMDRLLIDRRWLDEKSPQAQCLYDCWQVIRAANRAESAPSAAPNTARAQSCDGCTADEMDCIRCVRNEHVRDYYTTAPVA
jgi:hypothetical protein